MSELEKFKEFFNTIGVKYEEKSADYFKNSLSGTNPSNHDVNCLDGYIKLELDGYVLGYGCCRLLFARDDGRFIGVEAE